MGTWIKRAGTADGDNFQNEAVALTHKGEDLAWMVENEWDWSPWDNLKGERGQEKKGSISLGSPY